MIPLLWSLGVLAAPPQHLRVAAAAPARWGDLWDTAVAVRIWWDATPDGPVEIQVADSGRWRSLARDAAPGWIGAPLPRGAAIRAGRPGEWAESVFVPTWVSPTDLARLSGPTGAMLAGLVGQIDIDALSGTVWASTLGGGLVSVSRAGEVQARTTWDGLPDDTVIAVDVDGDRLLVGTAAGAMLLTGERPMRVWDERLPGLHAQAVLLSGDQLIVGTSSGLAELFVERVVSDGPPAVYSLAPARDGGVWVGMRGLRHRSADGAPVGEVQALDGDRIYAIADRSDGLWVASHEHGLRRGTPPSLAPVEGFPTSGIYGMAFTADGVWAAAGDQGLIGPDGRGYGFADGLPGRDAWSLAAANDTALWVGTDRGLARFVPGPADQPPRVDVVPMVRWPVTESVLTVSVGRHGIWVGGPRGVWSLGRPHRSTANLTVAGPRQARAIVEGGGYTWAIGERVVRMDKRGRLAAIALRERVRAAAWARDSLWLGTPDGIRRLDPDALTIEPWLALPGVQRLWATDRGFWALADDVPTLIVGRIPRPFLISTAVHDLAPLGAGVCLATDDGVLHLFPDGDVIDPLGDVDEGVHVDAVASDGAGGCWYASIDGRVGRIAADDAHAWAQLPFRDTVEVREIVADGDWAWVVTEEGTYRIWVPAP